MTAFKGITVRDFIKIREVAEEFKANPPRQLIHVMAIVLKKSTDEIGQMPYGDVKKLAKDNDWAFGYPDAPIKKKFRFKGRRFKAILDANKIKAGQFIDATELSKGDELEAARNLHILCGVLLEETTRFKKHLTDQEKFELVLDMPITYVYPNIVFFCKVYNALLPSIAIYLNQMGQQILAQHGSLEDTDGE